MKRKFPLRILSPRGHYSLSLFIMRIYKRSEAKQIFWRQNLINLNQFKFFGGEI